MREEQKRSKSGSPSLDRTGLRDNLIGMEVDDEEYGRGKIVFQAKGSVTVRSNETGKMFMLPESSLIDNT